MNSLYQRQHLLTSGYNRLLIQFKKKHVTLHSWYIVVAYISHILRGNLHYNVYIPAYFLIIIFVFLNWGRLSLFHTKKMNSRKQRMKGYTKHNVHINLMSANHTSHDNVSKGCACAQSLSVLFPVEVPLATGNTYFHLLHSMCIAPVFLQSFLIIHLLVFSAWDCNFHWPTNSSVFFFFFG